MFLLLANLPDYGPGSAEIVSVIRIFCFEGRLTSRCSITSKPFFTNHHWGPCEHFWGEKSWAATALVLSILYIE